LQFAAILRPALREFHVLIEIEEDSTGSVELVTLHSDLAPGVTLDDRKSFGSLDDAVAYAKNLSAEERERSWFRRGGKIQSLDDAEAELNVHRAQCSL
jgi:hypothetical protein